MGLSCRSMANAGLFKKGKKAGPGRPKGVPNKITQSVKEAVKEAFDELQGVPGASLKDWATANPSDFYRIAAKLIPNTVEAEVSGRVDHTYTEIVRRVVKP